MTNTLKDCNKQLDILQKTLIKQLETTKIEYIDLRTYYRKVEALKTKKDTLYLESF